jgi:hypothetical protein
MTRREQNARLRPRARSSINKGQKRLHTVHAGVRAGAREARFKNGGKRRERTGRFLAGNSGGSDTRRAREGGAMAGS